MSIPVWKGLWKSCDQLCWVEDDNEAVVYNPVSGSTHLLNYAAIKTIRLLQKQPLSAGGLIQRLGNEFAIKDNDEFTASINQVLTEFDQLGLIQPHIDIS